MVKNGYRGEVIELCWETRWDDADLRAAILRQRCK